MLSPPTTEPPIVNRVAQSGIVTLNLEAYYPNNEAILFDLKDYLFMGLILKEKDFREALTKHDWTQYQGKNIAITCSANAIIPLWAYMLVANYLTQYANYFAVVANTQVLTDLIFIQNLSQQINPERYRDRLVFVKGCVDKTIPAAAFAEITRLLQPVVKTLMYGEPCSTVPIYKQK